MVRLLEIDGDFCWGFHQRIWWIVEVSASLLESTSHTTWISWEMPIICAMVKLRGDWFIWLVVLPSGNLLHSYWKWLIYSWFSHSKWWFSMVMLVYKRVTILKNDGLRQWVSDDIPYMKWKIIHSCLKPSTSHGHLSHHCNPEKIGRKIPLDHPMNALMTIPQDWYTIGTRFNLTITINMILDDFSVS